MSSSKKTTTASALMAATVLALAALSPQQQNHVEAAPFLSSIRNPIKTSGSWMMPTQNSKWALSMRGGDEAPEEDAESAAVEEVLYLPGLLDVELTHSDHVSDNLTSMLINRRKAGM